MENEYLKKLSDYLKKGAKLTSENCPICGSLLIKIDDKYYCAKCEREVLFASSREEYVKLSSKLVLTQLKEDLIRGINGLREKFNKTPENLALLETLDKYLTILEKIDQLLSV